MDDFPITVVPPNTAVLGTGEKPSVFQNGGIGREYNLEKPYLGLEMRYWEGGGIGREAVLGGAVLVGTAVLAFKTYLNLLITKSLLSGDTIVHHHHF